MDLPDEQVLDNDERRQIIKALIVNKARISPDFSVDRAVNCTAGYNAGELKLVCKKAEQFTLRRIIRIRSEHGNDLFSPIPEQELGFMFLKTEDFMEAIDEVARGTKLDGFEGIPKIDWDDVYITALLREEITAFLASGLQRKTGCLLLHGPCGCGKRLATKAAARAAQANFLYIEGREMQIKLTRDARGNVERLFYLAKKGKPTVIYFDEIDEVISHQAGWNLILPAQLLTEVHNLTSSDRVCVVMATSSDELIHSDFYEKKLNFLLPTAKERASILSILAKGKPLATDVDFNSIAGVESCNGLSAADLCTLVREAAMISLQESQASGSRPVLSQHHFLAALLRVTQIARDFPVRDSDQ